jgi:L-fuconolactonase
MQVLQRDFLPADLQREIDATHIDAVVSVQARQSLVETEFLLQHAKAHPWIWGVVGWVPLQDPDVVSTLERLKDERWLKGVRHVVQDETDDRFLDRDSFNAGIRALRAFDLAYDILIFGRQLPMTLRFVDRHPDQRFILDHIAKPSIESGKWDLDWERGFRALAERPNVMCKFSALVTEVRDPKWDIELLRPYWRVALEAFGVDRLMFGSDWPVCLLRSSYADWVAAVSVYASDLSASEREKFWGGNAKRAYKLEA